MKNRRIAYVVRQVCAGKGSMVKLIQGRAWYCCPVCKQKLFPVKDGATCKGVFAPCKRCGSTREVIINYHEVKGVGAVNSS